MMDVSLFTRLGVRARHRDHLRGVLLDLRHAAAHHAVPAERARAITPEQTGLIILPFSVAVTVVSPLVGRVVGRFGARPPILIGLASLIAGLVVLMIARPRKRGARAAGSRAVPGSAARLCLTPDHDDRDDVGASAARGHGVRHHERAARDRVDRRLRGAGLGARGMARRHARARPCDRRDRTRPSARPSRSTIVQSANPRAHVAEIGPRHPITHPDPQRKCDRGRGGRGLRRGHPRRALGRDRAAAAVLPSDGSFFPRRRACVAGAEREAAKLASSEE